jgi:hypothetical protein
MVDVISAGIVIADWQLRVCWSCACKTSVLFSCTQGTGFLAQVW